jgi:ubiquitin-conjugating enzyme E2 variant
MTPPFFRKIETASVIAAPLMAAALIFKLSAGEASWSGSALILAWLAADGVSGLIHWAFDQLGDERTPLLGPTVIRTFREHHHDPASITRHDFIEVNGSNALAVLPVLGWALSPGADAHFWGQQVALWFSGFIILTNVSHRYAHAEAPPRWVQLLQKLHLLIPPAVHARHHEAPFNRSYCITTGWLNPLLDRLQFWKALDQLAQFFPLKTKR